jgi:DNA-binding protein H-NS
MNTITKPTESEQTLEILLEQQKALAASIAHIRLSKKKEAIEQCMALITAYSIEPHELKIKQKEKLTIEAKYKDPISGKTWSGRGKTPKWIKDTDRAAYLIK